MSPENRYDNDRPEWIPYARQSIDESDIQAVVQALRSNYVTQGPRIRWFEDALKELTGARHAIAVSSGTAALHLSCLCLDVTDGFSGIVPANTFVATANCLRFSGAKAIFADVDSQSGLAQAEHFNSAIEGSVKNGIKPKALLPVSYSGSCPDLEGIRKLADEHDMRVIHDASHSIGASYLSSDRSAHRSGSCAHADVAVFSFHPVKPICSGEGGALLTNDQAVAKRARALRSHGVERSEETVTKIGPWGYDQVELGLNYRMTELQAALGYSQLGKLDEFVQKRLALARRYNDFLSQAEFKKVFERPLLDERSSWHLYVIRFQESSLRDKAYHFLKERDIGTQVHYIPLYRHSYYEGGNHEELPGSESFYKACLSLPMYPALEEKDQDRTIEALKLFCERVTA